MWGIACTMFSQLHTNPTNSWIHHWKVVPIYRLSEVSVMKVDCDSVWEDFRLKLWISGRPTTESSLTSFVCIFNASLSINTAERKRYWNRPVAYPICRSVCLSVDLSARKVYSGKTAGWIRMPFEMVSGVGRGMGVLDGVVIIEGEGAVLWVNFGRRIVTNGDFAA